MLTEQIFTERHSHIQWLPSSPEVTSTENPHIVSLLRLHNYHCTVTTFALVLDTGVQAP